MTRARYKGNARTFEVVIRIGERLDFQFTAVAGACIYMADAQCASEHAVEVLLNMLDVNAVLVGFGQRLAEQPGAADTLQDIEHDGFTRRGRCRKG